MRIDEHMKELKEAIDNWAPEIEQVEIKSNDGVLGHLFDSIKSDKKMSLNHWRYKLLHWCFDEQKLPGFLYTHYCPLFHITNLILIFSPVIFTLKVIAAICTLCYLSVKFVLRKMDKTLKAIGDAVENRRETRRERYWQTKREEEEKRMAAFRAMTEEEREIEKQKELACITEVAKRIYKQNRKSFVDADSYYAKHGFQFTFFVANKVETALVQYRLLFLNSYDKSTSVLRIVEQIHTEAQEKQRLLAESRAKAIARAEAENAKRREKLKAWMIFWVNFSRIFVKSFLNVLYAGLFALTLYLTAFYIVPVAVDVVIWGIAVFADMASFDWLGWAGTIMGWCWTVAKFAFYIVSFVATGLSILWAGKKFVKASGLPVGPMFNKIMPPFRAIGYGFMAVKTAIVNGTKGVTDFVSVFYEENCPTITIIEDGEE